jgi:hypothetical protein
MRLGNPELSMEIIKSRCAANYDDDPLRLASFLSYHILRLLYYYKRHHLSPPVFFQSAQGLLRFLSVSWFDMGSTFIRILVPLRF